jgi:hypothetical protein
MGVSLALCLLLPATSRAEEAIVRLPWTQAPAGALLLPPSADHSTAFVRVEGTSGRTWALARIEKPALRTAVWAITGEVRYEGVEGQGYLEMWSFFPGGGHYFSRTLAQAGPMAAVSGSSGWRPFCLPFFNRPDQPGPVALEVNLALPGKGRVDIGALRLSQFAPGEDPLAVASGAWWSNRQMAWIGAVGGSLVGLAGALVGWLGGRGQAAALVLPLTAALAVVGGLLLLGGVAALTLAQPYLVWYPLLLGGGILAVVMGANYFRLRGRYREIELRRIQSVDAR